MNQKKTFEELQFKDDFMFGVIMRDPKFCKPFLEQILEVKISRIEYPKPQKTINLAADAKSVRLDIYVEDEQKTVYNIEMQTTEHRNLSRRTRYYQGIIDLNILEKGKDYKELKRSYVIFVCTFDLFGEGRHIYTFENRCIQNTNLALGDETAADAFTRELDEAVKAVRQNQKWRVDYMTLEMHYQEKYEEGREDGLRRGVQQGGEQKLVEQISKKRAKGKSVPVIADELEQDEATIEELIRKHSL